MTFTAWWIGAGFGYLVSSVVLLKKWTAEDTLVAIFLGVLYVIYGMMTDRGKRLTEKILSGRQK